VEGSYGNIDDLEDASDASNDFHTCGMGG
jgi:hypothetical protein